jgi:hypothetical protein
MSNSSNGNEQLNSTRDEYNNRVANKKLLGSTWRVKFNNQRRYRTI